MRVQAIMYAIEIVVAQHFVVFFQCATYNMLFSIIGNDFGIIT